MAHTRDDSESFSDHEPPPDPGDVYGHSPVRYPWRMVPEWWLLHPDMTGPVLMTGLVLAAIARSDPTAVPGRTRLARLRRCSVDAVDKHLTVLESIGAISKKPRYAGRHGQVSNLYVIHREPQQPIDGPRNLYEAEIAVGLRDGDGNPVKPPPKP